MSWTVTSATRPMNSTRSVSPRRPIGASTAVAGAASTAPEIVKAANSSANKSAHFPLLVRLA